MALREKYAMGHSGFNDFLFSIIGQETNGSDLTVLSTFARLGTDPWQEAARLSGLPKPAAVKALSEAIARMPEGDWTAGDLPRIATRLLDRLPGYCPPVQAETGAKKPMTNPAATKKPTRSDAFTWLLCLILTGAVFFALVHTFAGTEPPAKPNAPAAAPSSLPHGVPKV